MFSLYAISLRIADNVQIQLKQFDIHFEIKSGFMFREVNELLNSFMYLFQQCIENLSRYEIRIAYYIRKIILKEIYFS